MFRQAPAAGVLPFMLTGEAPRQAADRREWERCLDASPPPTGRDDVPEVLERLRVAGLNPDPTWRFRSALTVLKLLDDWSG